MTTKSARAYEVASAYNALELSGITDAYEMHGPGTIHVPTPLGTVFLSDTDGAAPDGSKEYVVGRTLADGSKEEQLWQGPGRQDAHIALVEWAQKDRNVTMPPTEAPSAPVQAVLTLNGRSVSVILEESREGPVVRLNGVNCSLEGFMPGEYLMLA
jgi:hypothetical protein